MRQLLPFAAGLALLSTSGCVSQSTGAQEPTTRRAEYVEALPDGRIPAGTHVWVQLEEPIGRDAAVGERFLARVTASVFAPDGAVLLPAGTPVVGRVIGLQPAENAVELAFDHMTIEGQRVPFAGRVVTTQVPGERGSRLVRAVKSPQVLVGSAFGGALGAGVGTAIALREGGKVGLPAGTQLEVAIEQPIASLASLRGREVD